MGFLSSLWNGVKSVAKAAAAVVTAPIWVPAGLAAVAADKLFGSSNSSSSSNNSSSNNYQQSPPPPPPRYTANSSVSQVDYTAERLREARQEFEDVARRNEKDCKRIIEKFFDIYDSKFRDEPSVQGYNLDRLRRKKDSILWDIDGTLTSRVSSAISLNDSETRRILGIDDYSEMRRQLLRKMNDVQKDTLNSVAGTVRERLTSLSQDIERFMQDRVEETEQNIQNQREIFAKWENDLDQKNFDRDQAQLIPAEKLFAIQLIEEKLGA